MKFPSDSGDCKLFLLLGVITLFVCFLKWTYSYWDRHGFKTLPDYYYLTGHFKLNIGRKSFVQQIIEFYNATDEPFIGIYFLLRPRLMVRDSKLIQSILIKDFSYFTDRNAFSNEKNDPLTGNLFVLPGHRWKAVRQHLTPAFSSGKLKAMFPILIECGSTLQNYLNKLADSDELFDVKEIAARHATNCIASIALGIDVDTINDPNNEFRVCGRNLTKPSTWNTIKRILLLGAPKLMIALRIKFFGMEVENFIISMVKKNLEFRETNNFVRKDFFQLLIQLRNGEVHLDDNDWHTNIETNENNKTMTVNEMAAHIFTFWFAGFETTSSTLAFCLYELAKNCDIQQRIHDEIDNILAAHSGQITYESISAMKYLDSCIDETLRMYPNVAFISRMCVQDYLIPNTKNIIKKGTPILIPAVALQRDEKYYPEPEKFVPDRFNDENSFGKNQLYRPYLPFGDGPRNCIAARLGKMQVKVGLVQMLQKFKFELENELKNRKLEFDPKVFLLTPLGGINLKVVKRRMNLDPGINAPNFVE